MRSTKTTQLAVISDNRSIARNSGNEFTSNIYQGNPSRPPVQLTQYYGTNMREYNTGDTLAVRKVRDLTDGIIWGQNYIVEYGLDGNVVFARLQRRDGKIYAYSTNVSAYPDGTLIHQPFELKYITNVYLIVGHSSPAQGSSYIIS